MNRLRKTFEQPSGSQPVILLAEDDPNDVILFRFAMQKEELDCQLFTVPDGTEVLEFLSGKGRYAQHPIPNLLVLDLKMPRLDGLGVLAWLQQRPQFNGIARVVLSSSNLESDIERSKELGADEYVVKPNENRELAELISGLHSRWLVCNTPSFFTIQSSRGLVTR
jgi:CheY-like chemotaxis protein